jgi:hypothetical protein
MHFIAEYQTGGIAVVALVAVISLVWLIHELFTDKGSHVKPRKEAKAEAAELRELMGQSLPDYDGQTYPPRRGVYDPDEYREEHHE